MCLDSLHTKSVMLALPCMHAHGMFRCSSRQQSLVWPLISMCMERKQMDGSLDLAQWHCSDRLCSQSCMWYIAALGSFYRSTMMNRPYCTYYPMCFCLECKSCCLPQLPDEGPAR